MKKRFSIIAALICMVSLAGCGKSEQVTSYESQKTGYATQLAVEAILPTMQYFMDGTMDAYAGTYAFDEYTMEETAYVAEQLFQIKADGYGFHNAINSFSSAVEEVGQIQSIGEAVATIDDDQIIVNVEVVGSKRNANAEIIFTNDLFMTLKSASLNADYTLGEKMSKAGLNTLIGMGTVFVMLIIISFIIALFGYIPKMEAYFADRAKKRAEAKNPAQAGIDNAVSQIIEQETAGAAELAGDEELVAVIAAAIAAYEGSASTDGFVVRSIRKIKR